jgi:hypothetical protein
MREAYRTPLRYGRRFFVLALQLASFPLVGWAACYPTPQAAIDRALSGSVIDPGSEGTGYTLVRIKRDPMLGRSWAVVARCSHPEWSTQAFPVFNLPSVEISPALSGSTHSSILIHAGDTVRFSRREALLQIEVAGISEDSGSLGGTVRVRISHMSADNPSAAEELTGIVRGPSDVEMKP